MTWTYAVATRSARNLTRERMADADPARPLVADEIIDGFLAEAGFTGTITATPTTATAAQVTYAAARSARVALGVLARSPDRSIESLSITRRTESYQAFVEGLEREAGISATPLGNMTAGGISRAADEAILTDPDYTGSHLYGDPWGHCS